MDIGMIGVGLLGSAIADRLLAAGHRIMGFDIDAGRLEWLKEQGGEGVDRATDIAATCQRIILSLPTSDDATAVIDEIAPALSPSASILDTTTGDPDSSVVHAETLERQGAVYLEACVVGSSRHVRVGDVVVLLGGNEEAAEQWRPLLAAFSDHQFYCGPSGCGAKMKLTVNLVMGLNRAALAEGLHFAERIGLEPEAALDVFRASFAYSRIMDAKGQKMLQRDFTPDARLRQHRKDVGLMIQLADQRDARLPLSETHARLLDCAIDGGFAELDNSAIIEAFPLLD